MPIFLVKCSEDFHANEKIFAAQSIEGIGLGIKECLLNWDIQMTDQQLNPQLEVILQSQSGFIDGGTKGSYLKVTITKTELLP